MMRKTPCIAAIAVMSLLLGTGWTYAQRGAVQPSAQELLFSITLRNDAKGMMETGPGGKQIQLEDHDGNPIELFEPAP